MDATSSSGSLLKLFPKLKKILPDGVSFEAGEAFSWSPKQARIIYKVDHKNEPQDLWALLHEASHALLGHQNYHRDIELLLLEVAAWQKAQDLAKQFDIQISEDHIQDCLDTYRDWLHQRATCPRCSTVSLQVSATEYSCHNCHALWGVSASRFCRPYRLSGKQNEPPRASARGIVLFTLIED
ncbi:MAG TPA: hypothetical protein VK674_02395 [Candidatus Limnocylindria bacterium]|nr:hypothetical protein [Candidatus Limnocylindria bacterium]